MTDYYDSPLGHVPAQAQTSQAQARGFIRPRPKFTQNFIRRCGVFLVDTTRLTTGADSSLFIPVPVDAFGVGLRSGSELWVSFQGEPSPPCVNQMSSAASPFDDQISVAVPFVNQTGIYTPPDTFDVWSVQGVNGILVSCAAHEAIINVLWF